MAAVTQDGLFLPDVPESLKTAEICMVAVQSHVVALGPF